MRHLRSRWGWNGLVAISWGLWSSSAAAGPPSEGRDEGTEVRVEPAAKPDIGRTDPVETPRLASLREQATQHHDETRRGDDPGAFDRADQAYREYLGLVPDDRDAYEMRHRHGMLQWEHADRLYASDDPDDRARAVELFRSAHDAFVRVLESKPEGKHHAEAAYAQMQAMRSHLEYTPRGARRHACKVNSEGICVDRHRRKKREKRRSGLEPTTPPPEPALTPYADAETLMLEAYARFEAHVDVAASHPDEVPKILYHRARLMAAHDRFAEARPLLERLIEEHDGTVQSAWGASMLVDLLTVEWTTAVQDEDRARARDDLEAWARRLDSMKLWKHREAAPLRELLPSLLAGIGWRRAEACTDSARDSDSPADFVPCAEQWVALFNEYEDHDRADTLLYNAARCFEAGYEVGNASYVRESLLARFPDSQHAQQTLYDLATSYHAIAFYAKAADRYEDYAQRYAKDRRSADALSNAYLFRVGLGQPARAIEDLERYEALYRRKDPERAARIFWARLELLEDPAERLRHAEEYIRRYRGKGGIDMLVVAHATVGQLQWRRSCAERGADDTCVSIVRDAISDEPRTGRRRRARPRGPRYCTEAGAGTVTVHRRNAELAQAAQAHFEAVIELASRARLPQHDPERASAFRDALGMSMVYRADRYYEEFLRGDSDAEPDGHDALEELSRDYSAVEKSGSIRWTTAALSRIALSHQALADRLRPRVPRTLGDEAERRAHCATADDPGESLRQEALDALRRCVDASVDAQSFDDFSRMCETELTRLDPKRYPATHELFGRSEYTRSRIVPVGVQRDP